MFLNERDIKIYGFLGGGIWVRVCRRTNVWDWRLSGLRGLGFGLVGLGWCFCFYFLWDFGRVFLIFRVCFFIWKMGLIIFFL